MASRMWRLTLSIEDDDGDVDELSESVYIDEDADYSLFKLACRRCWALLGRDFFDEKDLLDRYKPDTETP